jgi:hypothetical protein
MRGLFARASTYNTVEIRQNKETALRKLTHRQHTAYANGIEPIFVRGDLVAHFGGVFVITPTKYASQQEEDALNASVESSYLLQYEDHDLLTNARYFVTVDGCIESSGLARFSNGVLRRGARAIGLEHVNAEISFIELSVEHQLEIDGHRPTSLPCLVATRSIYANDEIIVDYGDEYWTDGMLQQELPPAVQDYLFARTDVPPPFFAH